MNTAENTEYGDKDLVEMGGRESGGWMDTAKLAEKMPELNRRLAEQPEDKSLNRSVQPIQKDFLPRLEKYEEQERMLAWRGCYARTENMPPTTI